MTLGQELDLYQTASDEEEVLDQVPASPEELYRLEGARLRHIADSFEVNIFSPINSYLI